MPTGVGDLSLDELARIDHILVTHPHLDHVLAIGLLADSHAPQVYITHIKPGEVDAVMNEVRALSTRHHIQALHTGQVMELR